MLTDRELNDSHTALLRYWVDQEIRVQIGKDHTILVGVSFTLAKENFNEERFSKTKFIEFKLISLCISAVSELPGH